MIAAIAMSALSLGAVLELGLAAFIRGRAGRRRDASAVAPAEAAAAAAVSVEQS